MVSVRIKWFVFFLFVFFFFPIGLKAAEKPEQTTKAESAKQTTKAQSAKQIEKPKASDTMMPPSMEPSTESKSSTSTSSNNKNVETLEVTGSYIRRSDIEGPSPIVVIEREELQRSGIQTVSNFLLRYNTVASFGGGGFRGLGGGRQLVLINGQRAPGSGSSYGSGPTGAVSTNFIPMAAVERIEILKDGASAIYGSDALTGVINIITRKDLDGMAVESNINVNEIKGGDNLRVAGVYGDTFSRGNFITSLQYSHSTKSRTSDNKRYEFVSDRFWRSTNYVSQTTRGIKPGPNCKRIVKGLCEDHVTAERVSNPSHSLDWVTDARYKISSDMELYSTLYLGWGQSSSRSYSPILYTPKGAGFEFDKTPPGWDHLPGIGSGPVTLTHRITELPGQESKNQGLSGGLIVGLNGYLGSSDWTWDISLNNQINYAKDERNNRALREPVYNAIKNGTYNPFGSSRNTDGFSYNAKGWDLFQVNWLEMKTTGNLGSVLGFDWSSAFGVSVANFAYKDDGDDMAKAGAIIGLKGVDASGDRQLYAAFAEFAGIYDDLELSLALRGDHYSDFGSTFNPKVALKYQFIDWLAIRTSWGTGFRAPAMQQVYGPPLPYFTQLTDWKKCLATGSDEDCQVDWRSVNEAGNPELKEETSQSFNFGIFLEPIKNLFFSVDYWNVAVNDVIDYDLDGLTQLAATDPTVGERYNLDIDRNPETGNIDNITVLLTNSGNQRSDGIDVNGSFKIPQTIFFLPKGTILVNTELTYIFNYYKQFFKEAPIIYDLGRAGFPRWRNITSLSYNTGPLTGTITARSAGKYEKNSRIGNNIPSYTQYDISINYQSPWGGIFNFGAINAFDGYPEYDRSTRGLVDTGLYSGLRTFFVGYRQDF